MSDDCHDPALDNPQASKDLSRGQTCAGCSHNHYSAPCGQKSGNRYFQGFDMHRPHSRCLHFDCQIPMHVDRFGSWLRSDIPAGCPTFSQGELAL